VLPLGSRPVEREGPAVAGSYAPVTVLVNERADGAHISCGRMASPLAPYENPDALKVARDLDLKLNTSYMDPNLILNLHDSREMEYAWDSSAGTRAKLKAMTSSCWPWARTAYFLNR
jgi:hypothetical protein